MGQQMPWKNDPRSQALSVERPLRLGNVLTTAAEVFTIFDQRRSQQFGRAG
jgi:hypothetical protein